MQELNDVSIPLLAGEAPKPPTEGELRLLRKQFITMQHSKVAGCGHKYDPERQPRHRNCDFCWLAFFQNHGEIVQTTDEIFQTRGKHLIIELQGKVFFNNFLKFMSTVNKIKEEQNAN